jgi:hypothetical protein
VHAPSDKQRRLGSLHSVDQEVEKVLVIMEGRASGEALIIWTGLWEGRKCSLLLGAGRKLHIGVERTASGEVEGPSGMKPRKTREVPAAVAAAN